MLSFCFAVSIHLAWQNAGNAQQAAMHSLPLFVRLVGRPVIVIGDGEAGAAKRQLLARVGAVIVDEGGHAALAIVALDDAAEAEATVARLRARGVLVNATDRPDLCDFTLPAIVDRDPVLVAIGTGGVSAGLAAALRQRLESVLPSSLGGLAHAFYGARAALKARYPDPRARRRAISAALRPGGALDPLRAHDEDAVTAWLGAPLTDNAAAAPETEHGASAPRTGHGNAQGITRIQLTSDDPDDLTLRAARLLAQADCVCHTPDVPAAILARARADAARVMCTEAPATCHHQLCVFLSF